MDSSEEREFLKNQAKQKLQDEKDTKLTSTVQELFPVIVKYLTEDHLKNDPSLLSACEDLLDFMASNCDPADILINFLEQMELSESDFRFRVLLKPVSTSMIKSGADLGFWIVSVVSTIRAYVEELPQPPNEKPAEKSVDSTAKRLCETYEAIVNCLRPVAALAEDEQHGKVRLHVLFLHLTLFGKPLAYLDINTSHDELTPFHTAVMQMSQLSGNLLEFLSFIENRTGKRRQPSNYDNNPENLAMLKVELFDFEATDLMYANFYFILLTSDTLHDKIPQVYHPHYLMRVCFYLGNFLLQQREYVLVRKGLCMLWKILQRVEIKSLGHESLEWTIHMELFASLSQVMIYCDSPEERKMALDIFQSHIKRFNMRARYLLLRQLYETSNHSGLMALVINTIKECVIESLEDNPACEFFTGPKLTSLLTRICSLSHGSTTDLVEISDEVISALNLLRFLVIRDTTGITGVWDVVGDLLENYLKPLREGIDMSRAHWKVKIRDLEEKQSKGIVELKNDDKVTVTVGGQDLPGMPVSEKINFCHQAINALDIMESITIRLNECIENKPVNFSQN